MSQSFDNLGISWRSFAFGAACGAGALGVIVFYHKYTRALVLAKDSFSGRRDELEAELHNIRQDLLALRRILTKPDSNALNNQTTSGLDVPDLQVNGAAANGEICTDASSESDDLEYSDAFESLFFNDAIGRKKIATVGPTTVESIESHKFIQQIDSLLDDESSSRDIRLAAQRMEEFTSDHDVDENIDFIIRQAQIKFHLSEMAKSEGDETRRKELAYEARDIATSALNLCQNQQPQPSPVPFLVYKWVAVTCGNVTDFMRIQEKVKAGKEFKNFLDKAIELNGEDALCHYMLGRYLWAIYKLSWYEKQVVKALFGSFDPVDLNDILNSFLAVERYNPDKYIDSQFHIAKCYIERGEMVAAIEWLKKAQLVPVADKEDEDILAEVKSLLKKMNY